MPVSFIQHIKNIMKVGPRSAWHQLMTIGDVKSGQLVGTDQFGNQYYQANDPNELFVRDRWVVPKLRQKFDPSQIPAEWSMWIHKIDSRTPQQMKDLTPKHKWMTAHASNKTGTADAYLPFDTTAPKINAWVPKVNPNRIHQK